MIGHFALSFCFISSLMGQGQLQLNLQQEDYEQLSREARPDSQQQCPAGCHCILSTVRCRGIDRVPPGIPTDATVLDLR